MKRTLNEQSTLAIIAAGTLLGDLLWSIALVRLWLLLRTLGIQTDIWNMVSALSQAGMRCPRRALLGSVDHPRTVVATPPLTVARQPAERIGLTAPRMLLDLIDGETLIHNRVVLVRDLKPRESC